MARKLRYNDEEGGMVKAQLQKIETYAAKLNDMIHPDDELEGWVQAKLAVVAAYMGDVKHYLDYELKQSFGEGGMPKFKQRHWEVEFTWDGADEEGRKVNVMADTIGEAEKKVKEKFGPYYKGLRIVEIEEDKEISWEDYEKKVKKKYSLKELDEITKTQMEHDEEQLRREQGLSKGGNVMMEGARIDGSKPMDAEEFGDDGEEYEAPNEEADRKHRKHEEMKEEEAIRSIEGKMADGGMMARGGEVFEVEGKKFYLKKDGLVYDEKGRVYGGKYKNKDEAYLSVKRNEMLLQNSSSSEDYLMMADGGELPAEKVYVEITKPTELKSKSVAKKVQEFADMGYRSGQILLKMAFVGSDKLSKELTDGFKVLKNNIFFIKRMNEHLKEKGIEPKKYYKGGRMSDMYVKYEGSTFSEDMQEAKEYLGEKMWNSFTREEKIEATKYLKAQGLVGYAGEMEDLETVSAMQYKRGGKAKSKK